MLQLWSLADETPVQFFDASGYDSDHDASNRQLVEGKTMFDVISVERIPEEDEQYLFYHKIISLECLELSYNQSTNINIHQ